MPPKPSAITFLSTPGQAYDDGMRFIQFYFGLPVAMVLIAAVAVPIYHRLQVFTAYEYLETRFDRRTRTLAASLFLVQRGLSNGLSLYAPALVLSAILGWNINLTVWLIGGLMISYTVAGGTRAVAVTQQGQVAVIFTGMVVAGYLLVHYLPPSVGFSEAMQVAGHQGKLNLVDFTFNPSDRYNFWTGMTGGLFLALSYFGTDQSQVQRYLSGRSITRKPPGLAHERPGEGAHAVRHSADRGAAVRVLSVQSAPAHLQPPRAGAGRQPARICPPASKSGAAPRYFIPRAARRQ